MVRGGWLGMLGEPGTRWIWSSLSASPRRVRRHIMNNVGFVNVSVGDGVVSDAR